MNKIYRANIINIIVLLVLSGVSFADEQKLLIDNEEGQCINKDPSTAGMNNCGYYAEIKWDAMMNKYYHLMMKELDKEQGLKLRESQRAWIKYRDKEFENINSMCLEHTEGTIYTNVASANKEALVKQRALDLRGYYQILHWDSIQNSIIKSDTYQ